MTLPDTGPPPRIALLGLASWDLLLAVSSYPAAGTWAPVADARSLPGGTTANSAVALARLGAQPALVAAVGDDPDGAAIRHSLAAEGVAIDWLATRPGEPTDRSTIVVSAEPAERTIFWQRGAAPRLGDRLAIEAIFNHDLVLLDLPDLPLRRFLLDLPAHSLPRTRLLGTLTHLADDAIPDAFDLALRHDVVVGSEREILTLTGTWTLADATAALQSRIPGANLRAAIVTRGADGCRIVTDHDRWQIPAFPTPVVDPTGAGDAFAAAVAYGLARRWDTADWPRLGRFANAVGALAIRSLGAQTALPRMPEVAALLATHPAPPDHRPTPVT